MRAYVHMICNDNLQVTWKKAFKILIEDISNRSNGIDC